MIKKSGKLILTMFNIGKLGKFPGTIASAITSFLYIFFFYFKVHYLTLFLIFLLLLLVSIYLINLLKDEFEEVDSKEIVIDEYYDTSFLVLAQKEMVICLAKNREIESALTFLELNKNHLAKNDLYDEAFDIIGYMQSKIASELK